MTQLEISTADAALLKTNLAHRYPVRLNAAPKTIVATARINQSVFTYPIAELTVDNTTSWGAVETGMALWIGTEQGTWDITAGVVKKTPTSSILYMDAKSLGDSGYSRYIRQGLADDLYVTVLKHRPPWGLLSSIREGVFYKQWDIAYTDEGSNPTPIARFGRHLAVEASSGGTAIVTFTGSPVTWGIKTITSQQFSLDGGTAVAGDEFSSTVTGEFAPGFYVIRYIVNDSGSKAHTAFRYLWVNPYNDTGAHASFGSRFKWEVTRDNEESSGRGIDITVMGTLTQDDVYPGQPFLFTEDPTYGGSRVSDDSGINNNFIGYVAEVSPSRQQQQRRVSFKLQSPLQAARTIPAAPQLVSETETPTNWAQATSTLTNPVGGVWYIFKHHAPTLLAAHDFYFVDALKTYREQSLKFAQDDVAAQVGMFDETMPGRLGCLSDGTLVIAPSPIHMDNDDRNALPTKFSWDAGDIDAREGINYLYSFPQKIGQVKVLAFAFDGAPPGRPYASLAPGKAQGQGKGKGQVTYMIPASTAEAEQARLNELSGHQYAAENAPSSEFGFTADRNLDVVSPGDWRCWHFLDIPAELDPYGIGFQTRALPVRVIRSWKRTNTGALLKSVRNEFQLETFGQPGVTIPVEKDAWQDWITDGWNTQMAVDFDPKFDDEDEGGGEEDPEGETPGPGEYLVNFGASGWQDYEVQATLGGTPDVTSGGNIGNSAFVENTESSAFIGQSYSTDLQVVVTLETPRDVTAVEFDFSLLYDTGDLTISSYETEIGISGGGGTDSETIAMGWQTRLDTMSTTGITSVTVIVRLAGNTLVTGDVVTQLRIDNVRISYSA